MGSLQGQGIAVARREHWPELLQAGEAAPVGALGQGLAIAATAAPMDFSGGGGAGHGGGSGRACQQC